MRDLHKIIDALELATTPLREDREKVLVAFKTLKSITEKLEKVRAALVMASMGYAKNIQQNVDEAIDLIDTIIGD
ncbi:MAG: hypothetical protein EBZ49_03695 [Proteobacteria bacterium]|nr:hypothetical protein [Pseudomonadota bacterium]